MSAVQNCSETFIIKSMPDVCLSEMGCTHGAPPGGWRGLLKHKTKQNKTKNIDIGVLLFSMVQMHTTSTWKKTMLLSDQTKKAKSTVVVARSRKSTHDIYIVANNTEHGNGGKKRRRERKRGVESSGSGDGSGGRGFESDKWMCIPPTTTLVIQPCFLAFLFVSLRTLHGHYQTQSLFLFFLTGWQLWVIGWPCFSRLRSIDFPFLQSPRPWPIDYVYAAKCLARLCFHQS